MKRVSISTGEIACFDRGTGPVVLLVHGFPLDHQMWNAQQQALSERARVIVPDLRGFGESPIGQLDEPSDPSGMITMERYGDDLHELLDAIAIDEPVILVGFSMGGYVAWQFLQKFRQRVAALVQCDTRVVADDESGRAARLEMAANIDRWGSGRVFEMMKSKLFAPSTLQSNAPLVDQVCAVIERTSPAGIGAAQRGMAVRPDMSAMLPTIDVPALVICGAEDAISPPEEMSAIAAAIPNAQFVEVPDAGHLAPMENPTAVNDALVRFIATLG